MEITVEVKLSMDADERIHDLSDVDTAKVEESAEIAVHNALMSACVNGFGHPLSDYVTIEVLSVRCQPKGVDNAD